MLQSLGIVVQKAHRGFYVMSPTADDILGACEVRVAAASATPFAGSPTRSRQPTYRRSAACVDEMAMAIKVDDERLLSRLDRDFHETVCLLGAHPRVHEVLVRESAPMLGFFGIYARSSSRYPRWSSSCGRSLNP